MDFQPSMIRPACLIKPEDCVSNDEAAISLLRSEQVVVLGGVSLIGSDMNVVSVITILRVMPPHRNSVLMSGNHKAEGWSISFGHPDKKPEFEWIDSDTGEVPLPTLMLYFVGTATDPTLVSKEASKDDLKAIVQFVASFISDEGPPKGIDW